MRFHRDIKRHNGSETNGQVVVQLPPAMLLDGGHGEEESLGEGLQAVHARESPLAEKLRDMDIFLDTGGNWI